ncbi:GntR family transcriptional regulator [Agrococcus sp. SGAir0287]|uniref:GntR family transcriptional regulator n=1 Tax=Agrococcus sp. SGAir0287 TaxID=2070347 RepID=UPI001C2FDB11|nr:GntR family transcriptional regulator [Agrococcus sp. SGAir0287]
MIHADIVEQISSGALGPGTRLPSEQDLAKRYGVSRMTVRQALDLLASEEVIVRKHGSGTFVREHSRQGRHLDRLRSFAAELADADVVVDAEIVRFELVEAPDDVAEALALEPGDPVHRLTRVRRVDGIPAALQDAWVPSYVAPSLSREPLVDGSLYRTLAERHGVRLRWADQSMTAELLGEAEAALLRVEPGGAVLRGMRTTYSDADEPVEFTHGWTLPSFPLLLRIDAE